MKILKYTSPKSSFLSVDKNLNLVVEMILKNNRLKKLLYYPVEEALLKPNLTELQTSQLIGSYIKIVPRILIDEMIKDYIIINFDNFTESENPEFRNNTISFDIICHYDTWQLQDFQLRPFRIAAELDTMFNKKKLTGIGTLNFLGATKINLSPEYAGYSLIYITTQGGEDKINMPNEIDDEQYEQDYNELFNNK